MKNNKLTISLLVLFVAAFLGFLLQALVSSFDYGFDFEIFLGFFILFGLYWPLAVIGIIATALNISQNSKNLKVLALVLSSVMFFTGFLIVFSWGFNIALLVISIIDLVKHQETVAVNENQYETSSFEAQSTPIEAQTTPIEATTTTQEEVQENDDQVTDIYS